LVAIFHRFIQLHVKDHGLNVRPALEVLFVKGVKFVVLHNTNEILEKGVIERGFFVGSDFHASIYPLHCFPCIFPQKGTFWGVFIGCILGQHEENVPKDLPLPL
jgi:hypothetical protein